MKRRDFFAVAGAAAVAQSLVSCIKPASYSDKAFYINKPSVIIPKIRLSPDRIVKETVGLRPFRTLGPRVEKEALGSKILVHNYGHGGSGWSLSWGTGNQARNLVLETKEKKVGVIGCGIVGIATATLLQESGLDVTIYTKDLPPNVTSNLATGTWSPASRVCDRNLATPEMKIKWEDATKYSFRRLQMMLGMSDIVQWTDEYTVHKEVPKATDGNGGTEIFHIDGLVPEWRLLNKKEHPFSADLVRKRSNMVFNIPSCLNHLLNNFLLRGGKLQIIEIKSLENIDALPEKVIVNCMGLGAKEVLNDQNLMPISGQLACLIPQPEINYKLSTKGANFISRKDGIYLGGNGLEGNWNTTPDREVTEKWIAILSNVMKEMQG
jgi:D-amino-acid oxidase